MDVCGRHDDQPEECQGSALGNPSPPMSRVTPESNTATFSIIIVRLDVH